MSVREADLSFVWHPFQRNSVYADQQLVICRGEGAYVFDDEGRRYLDANTGLWNMSLGYSEQRVMDAIEQQLRPLPFAALTLYSHEPAVRLGEQLVMHAPDGLRRVFYTCSGAEGIETAIRLARHAACVRGEPERQIVLALHRSYHGTSYGALSATGLPHHRRHAGPMLPGVHHVSPPQEPGHRVTAEVALAEVGRAIELHGPRNIAAILIEPVMAVAGMVQHPPGYLLGLRRICDEVGAYLVMDEVVTGIGRAVDWYASTRLGVTPDLLLLAKGLSAGYLPLGAVLVHASIVDLCEASADAVLMHGTTFSGNPVACAAALACLRVIEEDELLAKVERDGTYLRESLQRRLSDLASVHEVRGIGRMLAIDFVEPVSRRPATRDRSAAIQRRARECGVIIRHTYDGASLSLAPPFILNQDELDRIAEVLDACLRHELDSGKAAVYGYAPPVLAAASEEAMKGPLQ